MRLRLALLIACLLGCSSSGKNQRPTPAPGKKITLFMTTELKGQIEPCGCTSDPLGDLARTAKLIADARAAAGEVLYIDGGSTLYADAAVAEKLVAQEKLKATLLAEQMTDTLKADAIGLGPFDLAMGVDLRSARHAVNLGADAGVPLAEPRVIESGGLRIGIFGAVSPTALSGFSVKATDPVEASKRAIAKLRESNVDIVVAILHMIRSEAASLVRKAPGIDFALVGQNAPEPNNISDDPIEAGTTWLIEPANRGQIVSRIDITVRAGGDGFADALGEARAKRELEAMPDQIAAREAELAKWKNDPSADKSFVASKERELADLKARKAKLESNPVVIPKAGSYFTFEQIRIAKGLACEPSVVKAKQGYDRAAGEANLAAFADDKPPPPAKGEASYVGVEECSFCHKEAVEMWETTKHFEAWETLEKVGKQLDLSCVYCHVTGFDKPGGSNLVVNEPLRDVQCETCHGPGSKHVEADGKGHIVLTPEESLCVVCHNSEHSDTFDFKPYLRDVTGKGHGEEFRKKLGEGKTGGELRKAALEKAGLSIGAGCPK